MVASRSVSRCTCLWAFSQPSFVAYWFLAWEVGGIFTAQWCSITGVSTIPWFFLPAPLEGTGEWALDQNPEWLEKESKACEPIILVMEKSICEKYLLLLHIIWNGWIELSESVPTGQHFDKIDGRTFENVSAIWTNVSKVKLIVLLLFVFISKLNTHTHTHTHTHYPPPLTGILVDHSASFSFSLSENTFLVMSVFSQFVALVIIPWVLLIYFFPINIIHFIQETF